MSKWKSEISKDVYVAISPLFYLSRIWGMAPFSISFSGSECIILKLSVTYTVYSFALGASLCIFSIHNLINVIKEDVSKYTISIGTTVVVQLNLLIGIFGLLFRLPYLFMYLNCIKEIDSVIPTNAAVSTKISSIRILVVIFGIQTIFMIFDLYMGGISGVANTEKSISINFIFHYLSYYVILTVVFQYAHMGLNEDVARRFLNVGTAVNDFKAIKWISSTNKDKLYKENRFSKRSLEEIITVYLKLCDAVDAVNDGYGFTILVIILTCLVQLTVHLYFVLSSVVKQTDIARITVECLWLLVHFFRLILVVEPCNNCLEKVKLLKSSAGTLQWIENESQYEEQISLLCAQLSQHPMVFSAFGLGTIDRSLITSFAGAVATYLVIIIQFEIPS